MTPGPHQALVMLRRSSAPLWILNVVLGPLVVEGVEVVDEVVDEVAFAPGFDLVGLRTASAPASLSVSEESSSDSAGP